MGLVKLGCMLETPLSGAISRKDSDVTSGNPQRLYARRLSAIDNIQLLTYNNKNFKLLFVDC